MADSHLDSDLETMEAEPLPNGTAPHQPDDQFPLARLGIWVFAASLTMGFAALAFLYLLRLPERANYVFEAPLTLWFSTAIIIVSSVFAQKALNAIRRGEPRKLPFQLALTFGAGVGFVTSQMLAWVGLVNAGVYAQTNPFSALFYVLTGVHALHVLGGIVWLGWLLYLSYAGAFTQQKHTGVYLGVFYWHFLAVVWLVLFSLLMFL